MFKNCRKDIDTKLSKGAIHADTADYMKRYDKNFNSIFSKAMEFNLGFLKKDSKTGASILIADYIEHYVLKQDKIQINFGSLYEQKERQYGLN